MHEYVSNLYKVDVCHNHCANCPSSYVICSFVIVIFVLFKQLLNVFPDKPIVSFTIVKEGVGEYAALHSDVKMLCNATGFPAPLIKVLRMENSKMLEIERSTSGISYTISNIQVADAKKYVCLASNAVGTVQMEKQVKVHCELLSLYFQLEPCPSSGRISYLLLLAFVFKDKLFISVSI